MKKVYTPGLSIAELRQKKHVEKFGHPAVPTTEMLDGHVQLVVKAKSLDKVFEAPHQTDISLDTGPTVLTANIAAYPKSTMTVADWDQIRDGKWTIAQLLSLIYANDLLAPAGKKKEDLISLVMENRKRII